VDADKKISNFTKRLIIGIIGVPLLVFIIYKGGYFFLTLSVIVQVLALYEFYNLFKTKNIFPLKIFSIIVYTGLLVLSFFYYEHLEYVINLFLIIILLTITFEVFRKEKRSPLNPIVSISGFLYLTVPFIFLNLFNLNAGKLPGNFNIVLYIFVLIWTCDTFAFFGGRLFGKHLLSEISPKKTVEGSIAGIIFTVGGALIFHYVTPDNLSLTDALITGLLIGIFSQVGDLFESMLKRYCGVKDSSNIIPGHGGILDRFDSLVFVSPMIYIYFIH